MRRATRQDREGPNPQQQQQQEADGCADGSIGPKLPQILLQHASALPLPKVVERLRATAAELVRSSVNPEFLEGESKRAIRHIVLAPCPIMHSLLMPAKSDVGPLGTLVALTLSGVTLAVVLGVLPGRRSNLRLDALVALLQYLMFLQASWTIGQSESIPYMARATELFVAFSMNFHAQLASGTHVFVIMVYQLAVFTTCWTPTELVPPMALLCFSLLMLHGFLQHAEHRQCQERLEAQAQAQRLNKLEQEAAAERQERITSCLGTVLRHMKVPLLLMRSDASRCLNEPEMSPRAAEIFSGRAAELWDIFVGLQGRVQEQLGTDLEETVSRGLDAGVRAALQPQPVTPVGLESLAQQRPSQRSLGAPNGEPQAPDTGQGGLRAVRVERRGPGSSSAASTSIASSANQQPRRSHGPMKHLRSVRVHFEALSKAPRISALTFRFSDRLGKRRPVIYDLFPENAEPLRKWVQEHINDEFVEVDSDTGAGAVELDETFGRVNVSLPPMKHLLEVVALPLGLMDMSPLCGSLVTFRGFTDGGEDGTVGEDDRTLRAVVELSEFS